MTTKNTKGTKEIKATVTAKLAAGTAIGDGQKAGRALRARLSNGKAEEND